MLLLNHTSVLACGLLLLQIAFAQPHGRRAFHGHHKRDVGVVTTTVTKTFYVGPDGKPFPGQESPSTSTAFINIHTADAKVLAPTTTTTPTPAPAVPTTNTAPVPVAKVESPEVEVVKHPATTKQTTAAAPVATEITTGGNKLAHGTTYTPFNDAGNGCKSDTQMQSEMREIAKHFSSVRLYSTECDMIAIIYPTCKELGLKILAGIYDVGSQASEEVSTLIAQVKGDWSMIEGVGFANEAASGGRASVGDIVAAVNAGRAQLRTAGFNGPVFAVEAMFYMLTHLELCQNSDIVVANCHAFFDPSTLPALAGPFVKTQMIAAQLACGGKKVLISETGWPHAGAPFSADSVPSIDNQKAAIKSLSDSVGDSIFIFSMFNELWKPDLPGTSGIEIAWGIFGNVI